MSKIGIIGDKDTVLAFNVLGITVFTTSDTREVARTIAAWAKNDYGIIYITEQLALQMKDTLDVYKNSTVPAIIIIPNNSGSMGTGLAALKERVEKAIGANILD